MSVDPLIGKGVGNYLIVSLLQEGGMGKVYVGEHPEIGRRVAIKVISPEHTARPGIADRFLAEAKAISRIKHPNIVDIYDFGRTDDGRLYYTMELLEGRDLDAVMAKTGPLSATDVVPYVKGICSGLQAAHKKGVIHRDLKPGNIFVLDTEPRWIKILDFGIAKLLESEAGGISGGPSLTSTGMVMGTPFTIAPEQAAGRIDQIGPHTDLYSLGVIIYWMLSGRPPFKDEPTPIILAKHIQDQPPPLRLLAPTISEGVAEIVEACLSKDPQMRPDSANELAADFSRAALAGQGMVEPTDKMRALPRTTEPKFAATLASKPAPQAGSAVAPKPVAVTVHKPAWAPAPRPASAADTKPAAAAATPQRDTAPAPKPTSAADSEPDAARGATELPLATTLDPTSSAEIWQVMSPGRTRKKWLAVVIGVLLLGLVVAALLRRGTEQSPRDRARRAGRPEVPAARATLDAPAIAATRPMHTVTVLIEDVEAICTSMVGNQEPRKQRSPCLVRVPNGEWLTLEVARPGYQSFVMRRNIQHEETMQMLSDAQGKRIVLTQPEAEGTDPSPRPTKTRRSPPKRTGAPSRAAIRAPVRRTRPDRATPPNQATVKSADETPKATRDHSAAQPPKEPGPAVPSPPERPERPPTDNVDPWDN